MPDIDEVINRVDEWKGKKVDISELTEGLTNSNYKITVEGKSFVARIPGHGSDIFIDRDVELHNTLSASDIGVGARVFHSFESDYIIIAEFIQGNVMSKEAFSDKDVIKRAVQSIKTVNTGATFVSRFVMFDKFEEYMRIVRTHSIKIPVNFSEAEQFVITVGKKFKKNMPELLSCHNDLLAENFIDQGDRMRIIDWELSGLNDPCFELGDFSVEQEFDEEVDRIIIESYFGEFDEGKFARTSIYKSMADILWTLWAMIQNHFSTLEFDYWQYGIERFNRAMSAMNGKEFEKWLKMA